MNNKRIAKSITFGCWKNYSKWYDLLLQLLFQYVNFVNKLQLITPTKPQLIRQLNYLYYLIFLSIQRKTQPEFSQARFSHSGFSLTQASRVDKHYLSLKSKKVNLKQTKIANFLLQSSSCLLLNKMKSVKWTFNIN